ncbi:MAG: 4-hydroxy-tetrahydrodipicolinate reductase [Peptococcaceae bacterium]|jgi:4-hydroxy-tetrahydrodipicolinate reductase|nr:4-hydroxy-tetrahydrodipicolinate reductase [Peptococcaceae bacterium]
MLRICLIGLGRTGKEIAKLILAQEDMQLVMAVCGPNSEKAGKDLGDVLNIKANGIPVSENQHLEHQLLRFQPDVAIDFSSPEATLENLPMLGKMKTPVVIGTTGFDEKQRWKLNSLVHHHKMGVAITPNVTFGVNVLMLLTHLAAGILGDYDCTIVESHFSQKKDSPSGTAAMIAREIASSRNYGEDQEPTPIHSLRAGGIIGSHKVVLAGEFDKIEIVHESFSRTAFAQGALKAARFIYGKSGLYEMSDILNLKNALQAYMEKDPSSRWSKLAEDEFSHIPSESHNYNIL